VVGRDDRRHDVPAEGGARLEEKPLAFALDRAYLQARAVGGEPGVELDRHPREEVAADRRGAGEYDLGPAVADEVGEDLAVWLAPVIGEFRRVDLDYFINGKLEKRVACVVKVVAEDDHDERDAERVGEFAALTGEFERDRLDLPAALLAEDPDALEFGQVHRPRGRRRLGHVQFKSFDLARLDACAAERALVEVDDSDLARKSLLAFRRLRKRYSVAVDNLKRRERARLNAQAAAGTLPVDYLQSHPSSQSSQRFTNFSRFL